MATAALLVEPASLTAAGLAYHRLLRVHGGRVDAGRGHQRCLRRRVSELSPPALRGLYQGIWGSSWGLAFFVGPVLGGFVFGHFGSGALWAGAIVLGLILSVSYLRRRSLPADAQQATLRSRVDN
jgi:hypothetical protein